MGYEFEKTPLSIDEIKFMRRFEETQRSAHENATVKGLVKGQSYIRHLEQLLEEVEEFSQCAGSDTESSVIPPYSQDAEELADVVITAMTCAQHFSIPLAQAIVHKMRYNATRPWKHGKTGERGFCCADYDDHGSAPK